MRSWDGRSSELRGTLERGFRSDILSFALYGRHLVVIDGRKQLDYSDLFTPFHYGDVFSSCWTLPLQFYSPCLALSGSMSIRFRALPVLIGRGVNKQGLEFFDERLCRNRCDFRSSGWSKVEIELVKTAFESLLNPSL